MTKTRSTKSALLSSALALFLCFAMLLGTTFAWFTDSVESGTNQIVAGNLDIELEYKKVVDGVTATDWAPVAGDAAIFDPNALWEPGRFEVVYLKVSNLGSLALKYQLGVNVYSETPGTNVNGKEFKLSDFLVFKTVLIEENEVGKYTRENAVDASDALGFKDYNGKTTALDAKDGNNDTDYVALIVYMPTTVGNDANYKTGTTPPSIDFGIKLYATQQGAESDSFGDDYDDDAWVDGMLVFSEKDFQAALNEGKKIILGADLTSENGFVIGNEASTFSLRSAPTKVEINLNGKTMTATGERAYLFNVIGNTDFTITNGKLVAESTNGMLNGTGASTGASSSIYFNSTGKLTVSDVEIQGSVRGGHRAIDIYGGNAVISDTVINTSFGAGVVAGGEGVTAVLDNCDITVNGMYSAPYNSVCFGVWGGAELTVNSGNYKMINDNTYNTGDTHGGWVGIVMNSGGTITTLGGTYTNVPAEGFMPQYERAILEAENNAPAVSTLNILGGIFKPQEDQVYGGYGNQYYPTYNVPNLIDAGNGTWVAAPEGVDEAVSTPEKLETVLSAAGAAGSGDTEIYLAGDIDLTGTTWTPIKVDGYNGAGVVTIDGNGATIKGLTAPLFAGGFAGKSGIVIKNLTIADSNIVSTSGLGGGAFIDSSDSMHVITLDNCHLVNSTVTGERTGGLLGWCSGYAKLNDGPVKAYVTINNCSVVDSKVIGAGSAAAIAGHPGASDYTYTTIENCKVENVDVISNDTGSWRTGAIVGTANNGHVVINNVSVEDVTLTQNGVTAENTVLFGRFVPSGTGTLEIDGATVVADAATLKAVLTGDAEEISVILAGDIALDISTGLNLGAAETKSITIDGNGKKLTLSNTYRSYFNLANEEGVLNLKNMVLTNAHKGTHFFDYTTHFNCDVNAENVVFEKSPLVTAGAKAVFTDCSFTQASTDAYALWIMSGSDVTVNGGVVTSERGFKIADEDSAKAATVLNVTGTKFNNIKKAAILVTTNYGATITVDGLDISNCAADNKNEVWIDDGRTATKDSITVIGGNVIIEP